MTRIFNADYQVDQTPDWPTRNETVVRVESGELLCNHTGSYFDCRFYPKHGDSWIGKFEITDSVAGIKEVFSCPIIDDALVVSGSSGYWVKVSKREVFHLRVPPITSTTCAPQENLILITTWRDLIAYSSEHPEWIAKNIAEDDLKIFKINPSSVILHGYRDGQECCIDFNLHEKRMSSCCSVCE